MQKKIKSILIEGAGYKYAEEEIEGNEQSLIQPMGTSSVETTPILFRATDFGNWFVQGNTEWNSRYVIEVNYYE